MNWAMPWDIGFPQEKQNGKSLRDPAPGCLAHQGISSA